MELNFKLSVDEVNAILQALGNRPYAEVQALIAKIKADGEAQIAATKPPELAGYAPSFE